MRLQVFLSHNGVCSRRDAMDVIQSGRVAVNGRVVKEPSMAVDGSEAITVDGQKIGAKEYAYVMLNKPAGFTTTKDDPHAEKTVMDLLPSSMRHLSPVGRLDRDSEGLLLLTNDGDMSFRLTHPKFHAEKTYLVRVKGELTASKQSKLESGIMVEEQQTAPCRIREVKYNGTDTEFKITLHEGRKRQVRMMARAVGHHVNYLCRLSMGKLQLGNLPKGQWRVLTRQEVGLLE
ncbi:MAG: rRNA pseudouridine synthase [Candidatus Omnitrophica bacterium]|nr:rRNA pseudouridine synthase [Candidatus Omnitrophota bacterium]MDE2009145.1 rRNA pseudouridine synthase [Candidatus Omnitrophota bacterium]MDE2215062.1 rRNA pseudouridine synthase [Candidatus Omnitrophota bacterium]MDE2231762.1 rRNA pseudouridine synthase [Candidatus Omnitrophota bacterium]